MFLIKTRPGWRGVDHILRQHRVGHWHPERLKFFLSQHEAKFCLVYERKAKTYQSSGEQYSTGLWLMPDLVGVKIMLVGTRKLV